MVIGDVRNNAMEFSAWVKMISRNKAKMNKFKDEHTEQEIILFTEYVDEQIIIQMQSVNAIFLSNPAWKYGKNFKIAELEELKKVRTLLEQI